VRKAADAKLLNEKEGYQKLEKIAANAAVSKFSMEKNAILKEIKSRSKE
jgi:hypothetical protein